MPLIHMTALLLAPLSLDTADLLREPAYSVAKDCDRWVVQKPAFGARQPFTISYHRDRGPAESLRRSLPRLRLNVPFVRFDPATFERAAIEDWTAQEDARDVAADVHELLDRFGPAGSRALLQSTPLFAARLSGATGYTAEESSDHARFVIYLDPFRATGRLHAAATLLHELTHLSRYRARGFHANRTAAVLPKEDFILLGLADELAACQAEANLVRSFLDAQAKEEMRRAVGDTLRNPELRWPVALAVMLGFEGPSEPARRLPEVRRQVVLDLARNAARYWESRQSTALDPLVRQKIRDWYRRSREWKQIEAERPEWRKAQAVPVPSRP
jgi:hypothetical protein